MPRLAHAYRGPAILAVAGGSLALVGAVPVAITFGMGIKTSATVIGVGFMGFGIMLLLPAVCWCLIVKRRKSTWWRSCSGSKQKDYHAHAEEGVQTPALSDDNTDRKDPEHDPEHDMKHDNSYHPLVENMVTNSSSPLVENM